MVRQVTSQKLTKIQYAVELLHDVTLINSYETKLVYDILMFFLLFEGCKKPLDHNYLKKGGGGEKNIK